MITLFLLMCSVELEQLELREDSKRFLGKEWKDVPAERLWIDQCVAKKEMGLL
jgi:hypothetical protein